MGFNPYGQFYYEASDVASTIRNIKKSNKKEVEDLKNTIEYQKQLIEQLTKMKEDKNAQASVSSKDC